MYRAPNQVYSSDAKQTEHANDGMMDDTTKPILNSMHTSRPLQKYSASAANAVVALIAKTCQVLRKKYDCSEKPSRHHVFITGD